MRTLVLIVAILSLGCQRQQSSLTTGPEKAVPMGDTTRLLMVTYPLISAASIHTERTRNFFGVTFQDGRNSQVFIDFVHPHMPAALTELKRGDRVIAINGERARRLNARDMTELVLRLGLDGINELKLAVERNGRIRLIEIPAMKASLHSVALSDNPDIKISSNGLQVTVTTGLLNFVENDHQLALLISHEIGHSILGHGSRLSSYSGAQSLRPDMTGQIPTYKNEQAAPRGSLQGHSLTQELEADRLAMNLMRDAGYQQVLGNAVWERLAMAPLKGLKIPLLDEHPLTPERLKHITGIPDEKR